VNAQSEAYESALAEAGIPYLVRGGERFFNRTEVRQAMSALRAASGDVSSDLVTTVRSVLARVGLTESPPAGGAAKERWDALLAIVELAEELASTVADADLPRFNMELDQRAAAQHPPTVEGVTLASLHAAKGLEWDAVFLVGLSEGLMPISFAEGQEAIEEERRLLYVGITRAREHLHLSWSRARMPGGRAGRSPSRFLEGIFPEAARGDLAAQEARRRDAPRKRSAPPTLCRVCGGTLSSAVELKVGRCSSCPSTYDEQLFERLREWRSTVATEAKLPAYVVFTDATLVAIAETMPADEGELARVPGVGVGKLQRYGEAVLQVLSSTE